MDNSPGSLFDSHEQDFQQIISSIKEKLEGDAKEQQGAGEKRKTALRSVEIELDEADEAISQMDFEIQDIPQPVNSQYPSRIRTAKSELSRYKKLAKDLHAQLDRSELLSSARGLHTGSSAIEDTYGSSDRNRLLVGTSILADSSRRLQDSQRIALETEEQGADILTNLRRQREQLENSREMVHGANTSIDSASETLKKMLKRFF